MTTRHTPGPWAVERDDNGRAASIGHGHILIASMCGPNPVSNAALIAAAPDLLAACERLSDWDRTIDPDNVASRGDQQKLVNAIFMARAAIAKAKGAK